MPVNYDFIRRGVIRRGYTAEVTASRYHGLQNVLFGGSPIPGDANSGVIMYDFRRSNATPLSEEAVRGADPNRVNFRRLISMIRIPLTGSRLLKGFGVNRLNHPGLMIRE